MDHRDACPARLASAAGHFPALLPGGDAAQQGSSRQERRQRPHPPSHRDPERDRARVSETRSGHANRRFLTGRRPVPVHSLGPGDPCSDATAVSGAVLGLTAALLRRARAWQVSRGQPGIRAAGRPPAERGGPAGRGVTATRLPSGSWTLAAGVRPPRARDRERLPSSPLGLQRREQRPGRVRARPLRCRSQCAPYCGDMSSVPGHGPPECRCENSCLRARLVWCRLV